MSDTPAANVAVDAIVIENDCCGVDVSRRFASDTPTANAPASPSPLESSFRDFHC